MRCKSFRKQLVILLTAVMLLSSPMMRFTVSAAGDPVPELVEGAEDGGASTGSATGEEGSATAGDATAPELVEGSEDGGASTGSATDDEGSATGEADPEPVEGSEDGGTSTGSATAGEEDETPHQSPAETASPQEEASEDDAGPESAAPATDPEPVEGSEDGGASTGSATDPNTDPELVEGSEEDELITMEALAASTDDDIIASGYGNTSKNTVWEITQDPTNGLTLKVYGTRSGKEGSNFLDLSMDFDKDKSRYNTYWEEYRDQIKTVIIGQDVHVINTRVFSCHTALQQVIFEERENSYYNKLELVSCVFEGCTNLKVFTIPWFVNSIGDNLFIDSGVTDISIDRSNGSYYSVEDGVLYEKDYNNRSIVWVSPLKTDRKFEVPSDVVMIKRGAAYHYTALEELVLPEGLKNIEYRAFMECRNLRTVSFPLSLEKIDSHAFRDCVKLESVTLHENLFNLGYGAFWGCSSLKELTIPATCTYSDDGVSYAAVECDNLETLTIDARIRLFGYSGIGRSPVLKVKKELVLPGTLTTIQWSNIQAGQIRFRGTEAAWNAIEKKGDVAALAATPVIFDPEGVQTVSFDPNGGTGVMKDLVLKNDERKKLPKMTFQRIGYRFTGWGESPVNHSYYEKIYKDQEEVINPGTVTLYAYWEVNKFTLDFDANGAPNAVLTPLNTDAEGTGNSLPTVRRTGYRLTGWNTKKNGKGINVTSGKDLAATAKHGDVITLYAQWEETGVYPVHYSYNQSLVHTITNGKWNEFREYDTNAGLNKLPELKLLGDKYIFEGWYSDQNFKKKVTEIKKGTKGAVYLYAKITPKSYDIIFDGNADGKLYDPLTGQLTDETSSVKVKGSVKSIKGYHDLKPDLPVNKFTRKGYLFAGFAVLDGDTVKALFPAGCEADLESYVTWETEKSSGQLILTALWMKGGNLITFDAGEGTFDLSSLTGIDEYLTEESKDAISALSGDEGISSLTIWLPAGKTISQKNLPTTMQSCHTFKGWFSDEALKKQVKTLSVSKTDGILTLYAKTTVNTAVVKYTKGSPGNIKGSMKQVKLTGESKLQLPDCGFTNEVGYRFLGWKLTWKEDDSELYYPVWNEIVIQPEKDGQVFEIQAVWEPYSYRMTFISKGTEWKEQLEGIDWGESTGNFFTYVYKTNPAKRVKLPVKLEWEFGKEIYVLDHWEMYDTSEYYGYLRTGQAGKKVSYLEANLTDSMYLRAVWVRKTPIKGTVFYAKENTEGSETVSAAYQQTDMYYAKISLRTKPLQTKKGYALIGWNQGAVHKASLEDDYVAGFEDTYASPNATVTVSDGDIFYPVFAKRFEAILDPNLGSFTKDDILEKDKNKPVTLTYDYNKGLTKAQLKPYIPERQGYEFKGWQYTDYDGKVKTVTSIPKSLNRPVKLTAVWKEKTIKVVFYANIPKKDPLYKQLKGSMKTVSVKYSEYYRIPEVAYKVKGYRFNRWSYSPCDYRTSYSAITGPGFSIQWNKDWSFVDKNGVLRIYATWTKEEYRITYEGSSTDPKVGWEWPSDYTPTYRYNVATPTFTLGTPFRQGYIFRGWYTDPGYKKKVTQIKKGSTGDLTLYAKWEKRK